MLTSKIAFISGILVFMGLLAAIVSGSGHRFGMWSFMTGFMILGTGMLLAFAGAVCASVAIYQLRHQQGLSSLLLFLLLLVGVATMLIPASQIWLARKLPSIHDITTDTTQPPAFDEMHLSRDNSQNSTSYSGSTVSALQLQAYPDIRPLTINVQPEQAMSKALEVARSMGWEIVHIDNERYQFSATDTTFWFGFKDDIIVRVAALREGGTRIDARSLSRVGRGDLGTNARRIRHFFKLLSTHLEQVA